MQTIKFKITYIALIASLSDMFSHNISRMLLLYFQNMTRALCIIAKPDTSPNFASKI
jgi:hypothetical protein